MMPVLPQVVTSTRIVPVFTVDDPSTVAAVGRGLLDGGIGCVEVTLRTTHAWQAIETLRREVPELVVGVGTVLTADDANRAAAAGAAFMVSPGFSESALREAARIGLPAIPGIATPTEAMAAMAAGVETVKVFPAAILGGPDYLRTLSSVFPHLAFVPSGGLTAANAAEYLAVPSVAALSGSWMLPRDALAAGDTQRIAELSASAVDSIAAAS